MAYSAVKCPSSTSCIISFSLSSRPSSSWPWPSSRSPWPPRSSSMCSTASSGVITPSSASCIRCSTFSANSSPWCSESVPFAERDISSRASEVSPWEATTWTTSDLLELSNSEFRKSSKPKPFETSNLALLIAILWEGETWYMCTSAPAGTMEVDSTISPPITLTISASTVVVACTFILGDADVCIDWLGSAGVWVTPVGVASVPHATDRNNNTIAGRKASRIQSELGFILLVISRAPTQCIKNLR